MRGKRSSGIQVSKHIQFPGIVGRAPGQRKSHGMGERSPVAWELIVEAGRDPVTGRKRQISRTFPGGVRDAKKARAALLVEVGKGVTRGSRHARRLVRRVDRRAAPQEPLAEHGVRLREGRRAQHRATLLSP